MRRFALLMLIVAIGLSVARAEDWPTAAHDAARSGRTADVAPGPYRVRWAKAWQYENIATTCQLIVAEGRGFIGTLGRDGSLAGKVHCVDVRDGRDLWTFDQMQGGVAHTLTWSPANNGTVYAATTYGEVFALDAETGAVRWKFVTPLGGFVVNPCVANNAVLLGSRQGVFYALEEANGQVRWQRDVKLPICHTAAAADGVVYFLDEGIHTHALSIADGKPASGWIVRQLHGGSARFYWPVVTKDHVLLTVAPPHQYNWEVTDGVLFKQPRVNSRKQGDRFAEGTPADEQAEQANVIAFLKDAPHNRVMHCLARASGRPSCTPGVLYTGGSGSECAPPVLTKDGQIVVEYRSWYSLWDSESWVNPYSALGTLDPATGVVTQLRPQLEGKRVPWGHIWIIADESSAFSVAGDTLLVAHQGNVGGVDFANQNKTFAGVGKRDTWGGYPPLSWSRQEWHGGPRSPLTIVDGTVYYVVGGRVIACEGNAKSGEKNAEPEVVPATRVVKLREFVEEKRYPTEEDVTRLLDKWRARKPAAPDDTNKALIESLDKRVAEILEYEAHAPFHEWRGISSGSQSMTLAETVRALCIAKPYLSAARQKGITKFVNSAVLDERVFFDAPLEPLLHGASRNFHLRDGADFRASFSGPYSTIAGQGLQTRWAYVQSDPKADRSRAVAGGRVIHANRLASRPIAEVLSGDVREQWEQVGLYPRELTNLTGYIHYHSDAKTHHNTMWSTRTFVELFKTYLDHYRLVGRSCAKHIDAVPGDDKHPSAGGQFRNLGGPYVGETHMAAIVYWTDLCPEVGELLREFAPEETAAIKAWMLRNAQGFYLARWDTPVQEGEVACPWYVTTQNYFHFFSNIDKADAATLRLLVDRPVCYADVYYIERLVRAIEQR